MKCPLSLGPKRLYSPEVQTEGNSISDFVAKRLFLYRDGLLRTKGHTL